MSSYHQAITRQVFLEKFQALLNSIHQKEDQASAINQYIKSYLKLDGEPESLDSQIISYLQQNAKLQRHLVSAQQFGLTWEHTTLEEQGQNSYVQLSIVAVVFEAIAQTEEGLFDEKYGLTSKEIEPQKQSILDDFIKTIMPETRASTSIEGKLLGGIEGKIEKVLPSVKEEAKKLKKEEAMNKEAKIEPKVQIKKEVKPVKKAKKPAPKRKAAQQDSSWDWQTVGFFAAGAAAFVGLALLSKGRGGPSL